VRKKSDDSENSVYMRNYCMFAIIFFMYHKKILLRDFNAKVGRENVFKPTAGNVSIHEDSDDNGGRIVNFATSKNLVARNMKPS
jgi:hypothetical protein